MSTCLQCRRLLAALEAVYAATTSHVDGHDLLDELHPRSQLDIRRRVDGRVTWHQADWLSDLRDAMKAVDTILACAEQAKAEEQP